jgi:hypothetical protein
MIVDRSERVSPTNAGLGNPARLRFCWIVCYFEQNRKLGRMPRTAQCG